MRRCRITQDGIVRHRLSRSGATRPNMRCQALDRHGCRSLGDTIQRTSMLGQSRTTPSGIDCRDSAGRHCQALTVTMAAVWATRSSVLRCQITQGPGSTSCAAAGSAWAPNTPATRCADNAGPRVDALHCRRFGMGAEHTGNAVQRSAEGDAAEGIHGDRHSGRRYPGRQHVIG